MSVKTKTSHPVIALTECIACLMCVDVCPTGALDIITRNGEKGFRRYPGLKFPERCVSCAACTFECPTGAIVMKTATPGRDESEIT